VERPVPSPLAPGIVRRLALPLALAILPLAAGAPASAAATRIEETSPAVTYTGTWYPQYRSDLSGGSIVESPDLNGSATLAFDGTAASWIGFRASWGGIAEVWLDDRFVRTVDTYAPSDQAQAVLYTTGNLPAGPHTLRIKVTGTWNASGCCVWIVVDTFDVTTSSSPSKDRKQPTVAVTSPLDGSLVTGTVTIEATATDNRGVAGVQFFVDGSPVGLEDWGAPYSIDWTTTGTPDGAHVLTAVARDTSGNSAISAPVTVTLDNGRARTTGRFEEGSATLAPDGPWTGTTSGGVGVTLSGGAAVYASSPGASATFAFTGSGVSWVGFGCERCGVAEVYVDGALAGTVDTYTPSRPPASGVMWSVAGLAPGSHTLIVRATGTQNASSVGPYVVVDAFDVE